MSLQIESLWQLCIQQVYECHFPTTFAHFLSLCHILFILAILYFKLFQLHYIAMVICDQWSLMSLLYCFEAPRTLAAQDGELYQWLLCILTVPPASGPLICHILFGPPYFLRHKNTTIRTINKSTMASECSNERGNGTDLSLSQSQK